jgi:mannose-1-phosphate guanylyltransferase
MELCAIIMAGGRGTRFWPWSSDLLPKQFLPLAHPTKSLLQLTFERVAPLTGPERILVLTNHEYVPVVRTQLPMLSAGQVIGEPVLRDTAAAVAIGGAVAARRWPSAVQAVLPADHEVAPDARFREVLAQAASGAADDRRLYTLGILPARPTSAYGYLRRGARLPAEAGFVRSEVAAFVEKPDEATAKRYVDSGEYYWNAGIFVWRPDVLAEALARRLPEHARRMTAAAAVEGTDAFEAAMREAFTAVPKISVDFGMMQAEGEAGNVRVVEGDFRWNDLGGWSAFAEKLQPDPHGNRVFGHARDWNGDEWTEAWQPREPRPDDKDEDLSLGDVFTMESRNNLVFNSRRGHAVALYGVHDLAIVHTHRATLVVPRSLLDAIRPLVANLPDDRRRGGRVTPQRVEKPWGWELWWGWTEDFAGKTLFLRKGKRLSLQYHVVKEEVIYLHEGRARLQTAPRGEPLETFEMGPGDAVRVEAGRLHRLEAIEDCLLFESSLPFLWDVVRVADDFGREGTRQAEVPVKGRGGRDHDRKNDHDHDHDHDHVRKGTGGEA